MAKEKEFRPPKSVGACADLLYKTRLERLEIQKQVEKLEGAEKAIKDYLIAELPKEQATGAQGKVARVSLVEKIVPVAEDWEAIHAFVKKTGAFEILQKRLSVEAIVERWDNKVTIPGVGRIHNHTVSINKL